MYHLLNEAIRELTMLRDAANRGRLVVGMQW
jgi:hypothetical protein